MYVFKSDIFCYFTDTYFDLWNLWSSYFQSNNDTFRGCNYTGKIYLMKFSLVWRFIQLLTSLFLSLSLSLLARALRLQTCSLLAFWYSLLTRSYNICFYKFVLCSLLSKIYMTFTIDLSVCWNIDIFFNFSDF